MNFVLGVCYAGNFKESKEGFEYSLDLPGVEKENIKLTYENDQINISAIRKRGDEEQKINRSFYVPYVKDVKATVKNGVLTVTGKYSEGKSINIAWE